jgi:dipeptidyl aminopeptidase/acylaminoacyl peptidase
MRQLRTLLVVPALFCTLAINAQTDYQVPPAEILELADIKAPSLSMVSRNNKYLALLDRSLYKSLDELAETELRLAGLRINPESFSLSRGTFYTGLKIQHLLSKEPIAIKGLPSPLRMQTFSFSPRENYCAFINAGTDKLSLWIIDLKTGEAKELVHSGLSATMGAAYQWGPDETYLFCRWKGEKTKMEDTKQLPKGPATQDATGVKAPSRTYQDLLRNKQDEAKFDYYTTVSYRKVYIDGRPMQPVLKDAVYKSFSYSPNGQYILTEEVKQPYSYALTYGSFASQYNIYDIDGKFIKTFYNRPLQDKVPVNYDATEAGKRNVSWRSDMPSTLYWCVAPDGGDPEKESEFRDHVFQADFPFTEEKLMCKLKNRFAGIEFGKKDFAMVYDYWWKNRNTRTYIVNPSVDNSPLKLVYDLSSEDVYSDPGSFVSTYNEWNRPVLQFSKDGKNLYLTGEGYSPEGNRPFIDEFDIATTKTKRLWRADGKSTYERVIRLIDPEKKMALTSIESPKVYPNYYLRNYKSDSKPVQLTFKENPYKALMNVSKQKINYKRKDGVDLYATLYLPAGYNKAKDGRLPMLMDAYPTEFKDAKAAGQVKESPHAFISLYWASPVYWVTRGYAVLEDAQFPIIGKGKEEPNDTYNEQLVADAAAAIDAVDSLGVVDRTRCAVMGHSYGAFMTANLLAHSNLFAAGIARSGAYNRTLTPFSFQAEQRTYWEAQQIYNRMSPFNYADKIKSPLLLIHGDADNNPGTFTLQSERMFQAIKGTGGKARLVLLPYESHSYAARENILHMLWEMDTWLEKHVKNRKNISLN